MKLIERIRKIFAETAVKPEIIPPHMTSEIGWEDSLLYTGRDFPKYNPDALMTRKGADVYRKMMLDDQVKAAMQFKQFAVISRKWFFDIGTDENGAERADHQEMAEFFTHAVKTIRGHFSAHLINVLSALVNGFSITEKVFAPIDWQGKTMWGVAALKLRPFDSFNEGFEVDGHGNVLALNQNQSGTLVELPYDKVIHFVYQMDIDTHYGESDLRAAYRAWWSKDVAIKFQNIHLERHASGFVWARIMKALDSPARTRLKNMIRNISARMGAILPEGVELNAIQPLRTDAYDKAIAQHDKAIAKCILVPNLLGLAEQGQVGSYSQSETQLQAFFWILDFLAGLLAETLNEQLFTQLAMWNYATDDFPAFAFEPISDAQKERIAKAWSEMVSKGAVTKTDSDEAHARRLMGFPEKQEPAEGAEPVEADNEEWIETQDEERREFIRKEFAERPWLKRVDYTRTQRALDAQDTKFLEDLRTLMARVRMSVEQQIIKIAGKRSMGNVAPKEIEAVAVPKNIVNQVGKTVRANLAAILEDGFGLARRELPKKKFAQVRSGMDKTKAATFLSSRAMKIAGVLRDDVLKAVARVLENAIKYDKNLAQTIAALSEDTDIMRLLPGVDAAGRPVNIPARLENIVRTNTADAVNAGRMALFNDPSLRGFVQAFEYSAVMDSRVTEICEHLDGKILKDFGIYTPPNHYQCRSILVPVTAVDDWDGRVSSKPRLEPHKGFF